MAKRLTKEQWDYRLNRLALEIHRKPGNTVSLGDAALAALDHLGFKLISSDKACNAEGVTVKLLMNVLSNWPKTPRTFLAFCS